MLGLTCLALCAWHYVPGLTRAGPDNITLLRSVCPQTHTYDRQAGNTRPPSSYGTSLATDFATLRYIAPLWAALRHSVPLCANVRQSHARASVPRIPCKNRLSCPPPRQTEHSEQSSQHHDSNLRLLLVRVVIDYNVRTQLRTRYAIQPKRNV